MNSGSCLYRLSGCNLSEGSCRDLALVLSTETSSIKDLDLSDNNIQDSGIMLLSDGLNSPHCQAEVVRSVFSINIELNTITFYIVKYTKLIKCLYP